MQSLFSFPGAAALSVAVFAGTAAVLGAAALALVILLARGSGYAARWVAFGGAATAATYLAALTAVSLATPGRVVEPGEAGHFCEIDCPLAYSVAGVRRVESLGALRPSRGVWEVVTLRVRFDPSAAPHGVGVRPPTPDPREVFLVDAEGNRHAPSVEGMRALEAASGARPPLPPGEWHDAALVFDVSPDVPSRMLKRSEAGPVARLLIGHEGSLLHAPTVFRLPAPGTLAEVRS